MDYYPTTRTPGKYLFQEDSVEDVQDTVDTQEGVAALFHADTHQFMLDFDITNTHSMNA